MSGRARPLARYHAPSDARKRTGDVETLLLAVGRSFPRGERPTPTTVSVGSTDFSASYPAARYGPNVRAERCLLPENCGRQNAGWLGSLPTTNCLTVGYRWASSLSHAPNASSRASPASISRGGYG